MQKKAHLTDEEGWAPRDVCILTQNKKKNRQNTDWSVVHCTLRVENEDLKIDIYLYDKSVKITPALSLSFFFWAARDVCILTQKKK